MPRSTQSSSVLAINRHQSRPSMPFAPLRRFCDIILLSALLPSQAHAQPRISLHIQRLAFNGNLLKCADGTFIAERRGELYRLTATGAYKRKLDFDPTHPVAAFSASDTYFKRIFALLVDGGCFALVDFRIPNLGLVADRLARFDRDGRLVWADDRTYHLLPSALNFRMVELSSVSEIRDV